MPDNKDKSTNEKLDAIDDKVSELVTVLKGFNGYKGLCQRHEDLAESHYALQRKVTILIGLLIGAGVLTGGSVGIVQLIGG